MQIQKTIRLFHESRNAHIWNTTEKFYSADHIVPELIQRYRNIIKLVGLLKEAAAYLDEQAGELIFFNEGKFELPINFRLPDVQGSNQECILRLLESFSTETHREQKFAILAKSVHSICSPAKPKERFEILLERLPDLFRSFSEGYRLFVADFSYEKIINQLETAKLEEVSKIHKTFSDVQNQILGIPVATVIVATQMKAATSVGYEFWVNTAVLVGCWIFAVLSIFVLRNQLHTLTAIGSEIDRKKQQMIKQYKSVEDLIAKSFPFLEARLKAQKKAFITVDAILVVGLVLSHIVYIVLTEPARLWLLDKISYLFP